MGSPSGLWTAVSGSMAQSQKVDIIANNLANANTAGFKKDTPTFKEYLTAIERPPSPAIDIPRTAFKDSDFYHFDGREHAKVNLDKVHTDHTQGNLKVTNAPFDMAIDGTAYFAVQTPSGVLFTRAGDFKVNGEGVLVNQEGYPVLGMGAQEDAGGTAQQAQEAGATDRAPAGVNPFTVRLPAAPGEKSPLAVINLKDVLAGGQKVHISPQGEIFAGEELITKLALADFADPKALIKTTTSLYSNPNPENVPRVANSSTIRQGFLEASNVNPVVELLELLKANRAFESNMRAIRAYNDMAAKEANEVGKL